MRRTLAAVLLVSVSSCSFVFTRSPGDVGKPPQKIAACREGRGFPIADAVIGGVLLVSALSLIGQTSGPNGAGTDDNSNVPAILTGTALAAVFGASSYYGFTRTSRCRASHQEYLAAHPPPVLAPVAMAPPVGANGGACTAQLTCDAGLVCSGMPDHTNQCIVAPQIAQVPQTLVAPQTPVAQTPVAPQKPVVPQKPATPEKPAVPVGMQGGACTPQLTCVLGLVCAGMPDNTNKCMPAKGTYLPPQKDPTPAAPAAPAVGTQGGACTPKLTCNQGLVCSGMPDRTNQCIAAPAKQ